MDLRHDGLPGSSGAGSANGPPNISNIVNLVMKLKEALKCGICHSTVKSHTLTTCNHLFCQQCFNELKKKSARDRKDLCPICSQKINKRSCGNSNFVEELIGTYLKLAKTVTTELFSFDLPAQERFYESQVVMTQLPTAHTRFPPQPQMRVHQFVNHAGPSTSTYQLPPPPINYAPPVHYQAPVHYQPPVVNHQVLRTSRLIRQSQQNTGRFRRPNLQAGWKMQNQSQMIEEEEEEEEVDVGQQQSREEQPTLESRTDRAVFAKPANSMKVAPRPTVETRDFGVQGGPASCDSFVQCSVEMKDAGTAVEDHPSVRLESLKIDVIQLARDIKATEQCTPEEAISKVLYAMKVGVDEFLYSEQPNPANPGAFATQPFFTTNGKHEADVVDPNATGVVDLDETFPMELSEHPSLVAPQGISKDFGDSTLKAMEEDFTVNVSDDEEEEDEDSVPRKPLTSTPLTVKSNLPVKHTPGLSPITSSENTNKGRRTAVRNLSSIMEVDEQQVTPVVLKLKRGSSVNRDPETKKVKWDECQFRIAHGDSLDTVAEESAAHSTVVKTEPGLSKSLQRIEDKSTIGPEPTPFVKQEPETSTEEENIFTKSDLPSKLTPYTPYEDELQPIPAVPAIVKSEVRSQERQNFEEADCVPDSETEDCVPDSFADCVPESDVEQEEERKTANSEKENVFPNPRPTISLLATHTSTQKDQNLLRQFVEAFPEISLASTCSREVTHLVAFNTSYKICRKLSVKYLYALSRGLPIVTSNWMANSIKQKKLLDTKLYEIEGVEPVKKGTKACRRSREDVKRTLFEKFCFFVPEPFFQSKIMKRGTLIEMISACGGNVVNKPWELSCEADYNFIVYGTDIEDREDAEETARRFEMTTGSRVVSAGWVIESICNYRVALERLDLYRLGTCTGEGKS